MAQRERKCRGKRRDNGEWVYGWYIEMPGKQNAKIVDEAEGIVSCKLTDAETIPCIAYLGKSARALDFSIVDPATVGECTGHKDKNGKDLDWWEGDLFELYSDLPLYEIIMNQGCFWFASVGGTHRQRCDDVSDWALPPKKVGTIHDNPELLKE
jgi:hypothetical protein